MVKWLINFEESISTNDIFSNISSDFLFSFRKKKILKISTYPENNIIRLATVDWLVTKHLSAQGKPNPKGGLYYFCCQNKSWTSPLHACDTLTIIKYELEMRKMASKVERVKKSKKTNHPTLQSQFSNIPKILCMLLCCY